MKYGEPPDATKPTKHWRLYVFKGKEAIDPYHIHRQSMYLMGRERRVADIPLDHPSCSSQHCVLQFRMTQKTETNERGERRESKLVRPYLIDLGSTNGCYVNGDRIEAQRCVAMRARARVRACACACLCVWVHACACACLYVSPYVHVVHHVCLCLCVPVCAWLYVCESMHACLYAYGAPAGTSSCSRRTACALATAPASTCC